MASYPASVNPFGTIAASGASRSSLYSERTAVANLLAEVAAVATDLVAARGASGSIASRLTIIDTAITAGDSATLASASTDATTKANAAIATASADATTKANAAQSAAATDATTKANNALASALISQPGRNRLMNSNHVVRQRGNGTFVAAGYTADGTYTTPTGSTMVSSLQLHPVAGIPGVKESGYFHRTIVTSVAAAGNFVTQRYYIEGVETLAGQVCTVSWYAKADAAKPIAMEVSQYFGTGGSPSAQVIAIGASKPTLSTAWVRYTSTFTMPSISGKTLGTNNDHRVDVSFWYDAGSTYNARSSSLGQQSGTFDIDMVQMEAGAVATAFEFENPAITLQKCQRYYQKSYRESVVAPTVTQNDYEFVPGYSAVATSTPIAQIRFRVSMRATPTVSIYSYTSSTASVVSTAAGTDLAAGTGTPNTGNEKQYLISNNSGANATPSLGGFIFHWAATAEL